KDILPSYVTVWEYLSYFAALKLPGVPKAAREERIKEVLHSINLYHSKDTQIGGSSRKGLSGGEMKRVALAVELLNNPSLIFLDEPTSGLDAALAFDTMRLLLRLARAGGRTIVCTVHQPRSQLFAMFDELMLLHRGQIVFQGPAVECNAYFARLGLRCPSQFNPADFLLDLLTVRNEHREETLEAEGGVDLEQHLKLPSSHELPHQLSLRQLAGVSETQQSVEGYGLMGAVTQEPQGRDQSAAHILMETDVEEADAPALSHFESHLMRVTVTQEEIDRLPAFYKASPLCARIADRIERELELPPDKQLNRGLQERLMAHKDFL
ncbi:ABC transporter G family member ARB_01379, partial [Cyclospora cayetanensis]